MQDLRAGDRGGLLGGMVNEKGRFPEVCKKSVQAMAADLQGAIHAHFFSDFGLEQLKALTSRELEAARRLVDPMYAGPMDSHYRKIDWDEAFDRIAKKLRKTDPREAFFYFSGRSSNEAGFLMQLFARLLGHQQHQQLLVLLPSGLRASGCRA
jgi:anaerobic selenocysteine-containing dehydrogenase